MLGDFIPGWNARFVTDLVGLLRAEVNFTEWYEGKDFLLFSNGVLNVKTKELLSYSKEYNLIHRLPYPYNTDAQCPGIIEFLSFTQHDDPQRVSVLRAVLKGQRLLGHLRVPAVC